jgi:hypothetical protein
MLYLCLESCGDRLRTIADHPRYEEASIWDTVVTDVLLIWCIRQWKNLKTNICRQVVLVCNKQALLEVWHCYTLYRSLSHFHSRILYRRASCCNRQTLCRLALATTNFGHDLLFLSSYSISGSSFLQLITLLNAYLLITTCITVHLTDPQVLHVRLQKTRSGFHDSCFLLHKNRCLPRNSHRKCIVYTLTVAFAYNVDYFTRGSIAYSPSPHRCAATSLAARWIMLHYFAF